MTKIELSLRDFDWAMPVNQDAIVKQVIAHCYLLFENGSWEKQGFVCCVAIPSDEITEALKAEKTKEAEDGLYELVSRIRDSGEHGFPKKDEENFYVKVKIFPVE